ncbi:MoaD/ThiS family protein [Arthrobacter sp.]|uniref:MoaD/ThiS family protein n=1 Tax=Arthrobacter sp. TaxID=1667 RepID=UPI002810EE7B|nr:MoaD/ThiS family protein [Arthrobacter sp.]
MLVRYFAAACSAAGVEEEHHELTDGVTLSELLTAVLAVDRPEPPAGTPPLAGIIARSSFLRNEVAVRDVAVCLGRDDIIDVLPPFAGG